MFGVSLAGLLVFVVISVPLIGYSSTFIAKNVFDINLKGVGSDENRFSARHMDATGAAYNSFFNLGLSKVNFISHYTQHKTAGKITFEYIYWELWVLDNFDFNSALKLFNNLVADRVRGVELVSTQVDAKTFRIALKIDGVETHKVIFSKTGVEVENDAKSIAMVDVDKKIPKIHYIGPAKVAIIIDDIGYRQEVERQFLSLNAKLTFAILPYSPQGKNFAEQAHRLGNEVMLHLPMEPKAYPEIKPGKGGLLLNMSNDILRKTLKSNMSQIPYIKGINNHMGSAFTSDAEKMALILKDIKKSGLFFIDSRTAGSARGYEVAKAMGIPTAMRNVFLDHDPRSEQISRQFDLLMEIAKRKGSAIAIGHPHTATLNTLRVKLSELAKNKIIVVSASQLVH